MKKIFVVLFIFFLFSSNVFCKEEEESYILKKIKNNIILGWGKDEVGAMYSAYEIS